jgi:hypothetical protein
VLHGESAVVVAPWPTALVFPEPPHPHRVPCRRCT